MAALLPAEVEVRIVSEAFEDVNYDEKADLIGITSQTSNVLRAYEIADAFRRKGVAVVMGGIHVSMEPEEALEHCDTVIVGEADETWPRFIRDFQSGRQRRTYFPDKKPELGILPIPKFSLLDHSCYLSCRQEGIYSLFPAPMYPIQTARGCPHSCEMCSISRFSGGGYRTRPIPAVICEIRDLGARGCWFIDDTFFVDPLRAGALLEELMPLKLSWVAFANLDAGKNRELLRLARRSGCKMLIVGLESIFSQGLQSIRKGANRIEEYEGLLAALRGEGIAVMASVLFGLDHEPPDVFRKTCEFLIKNKVTYTLWYPVVPLPGTPFLERLKREGRLREEKWWLNPRLAGDFLSLKFMGGILPEDEFRKNFIHYLKKFYSPPSALRRILCPPQNRAPVKILLNGIMRSKISRRAALSEH